MTANPFPSSTKWVTPSAYTQEMLQSTEERLANTNDMQQPHIVELLDMSETTHQKLSLVDIDQPLFRLYPSELVFQNFTPAQTYKLRLVLRNIDTVSRRVIPELQESEYFQVVGPPDAGRRVAPGLSATFTVFFTPQENKDYHHRLVFVTERERFEVPVRAIGPRAILDFCDELHFPVCPLKSSTEKTQHVRNIGNAMAKFKLDTQSPFSVTPSSGTVDVGGSVQVTVEFHPLTVGVHSQSLVLHYHTGEDVHITLQAVCEELDIRLEADSVLLRKTYMSLASHRTVSLTYRSDVRLKYCWTTWPSLQEEALSLLRESSGLPQEKEIERERLLAQCEADPTVIHRLPLLSRALQERRSQTVRDQRLVLSHSCITVEPAEGEICPRTPAQFDIVFKPEEAKLYQQTIYCDITGREARLPLTIMAEGIGPNVQFNYDLMDMQNVVIGDKDYYELQVRNRGLIDAPFRLLSRDTTFGRCFSFCPEEGVIPSGACQKVDVIFCGHTLGTFTEDLLLTVTGGPQPLTVTFSGCVIAPTCHFNLTELNFEDVGFGFPLTLMCKLFNTSFVPITFALRVLGDGSGSPSITSARQVSLKDWGGSAAGDLHASPVEFTVTPAAGCVDAMSDVTIKVTLCSNTVKTYRMALVVDVEGVGKEIVTLPIKARCVVPNIEVKTPVLNFQRCFLNHRYEQKVQLTNTGPLPACYGVLDQEYEESPSLLFGSSTPTGMIRPHSSEELPVFLLAKAVGRQQHTLRIAVFGSFQPQEVVLSCIGQGPIVHVHSQQLDFGAIPVLTDITRSLHLSNQSPISAHFTARMVPRSHGGTFGRVEPSEGEVPPESQLELRVVAHLKDTLHFQAKMEVSIQNSHVHTVFLSATGTGTTIVSDRPFAPNLDLGTYLSHASCQYPFKLTNQGKRTHRLYWRTDGFLFSGKTPKGGRTVLPSLRAPSQKEGFIGESLPSSGEERPVFSLRPSHVELPPGRSVDMVLTGSSDSPKVVQERLLCHGIVGRQGCKELIMSVDLTCRFVAPMLRISSRQLKFHLEKVPGESLRPLYEKLVLENVLSLSLSVELSLVEPFYLCEAAGAHSTATTKFVVIGDGQQAELWVRFDPTYCQDQVSRVVEEVLEIHYQGHPEQHKVELYAEVHFPNLHFSDTTVDFGCVLNLTGARREISITNCSPLPVSYHWVFLADRKHGAIREAEVVEVEGEQTNPENGTEEEGWSSSRMPSFAFSDPLSLGPGADEGSSSRGPVGVQEVFDILPLFGHLQPGEQQQVVFCFYGHENVSKEVVAQCRVEDGPSYEVQLRGEASLISYSLDSTHINFGLQPFDHEGEAEVTLTNTGKIGFNFIIHPKKKDEDAEEEAGGQRKALEDEQKGERHVIPGRPMVIPATGYIDPGAERCLRVLYLPGTPERFERQLQLQVAFLLPQVLTLTGEGVFPRISLNLPQNLPEESFSDLVLQARTAVEGVELMNGTASDERQTTKANPPLTYKELLHMEIERMMVKQNALAVTDCLLELRELQGSSRRWHKLSQFLLPEYVLDFGYVIPAIPRSHSVKVTNTGSVAVSFKANVKPLAGTGFSTDFQSVKNLPCGETQTFTVKFDPQTADLKMGDTSVVMSIQVVGGPTVQVRLCALVTEPAVTISTDTLQFDTVQCGMCQMRTIQLFNQESVPCTWSIAEKGKPIKKRKKDLEMQQPPAVVFKMIPSSGMLSPGERVNVQIKFTPAEGGSYNRQLHVRVAESSQQLFITARGRAEEPHLEFCPSVLELGPCLPLATDAEVNVSVRNPCPFPVEFYSLELDTQYLKEEKILRLVKGYDKNRILLLPPRSPGESLPPELLEYYQEQRSQLKDDGLKQGLDEEGAEMGDTYKEGEMHSLSLKSAEVLVSEMTVVGSSVGLGQLEMNPVSRAIARHMRVDLSPEGLATRNRRGIAIIVYGAPLTDNGSCVAALARHYGAAHLSVDAVVTEVLVNGTSPISQTARQLYDCAAAGNAGKKPEEAAQSTEYEPETNLEASEPAPHSAPASRGTLEVPSKPIEDGFSGNDSKAPRGTENTHFTLFLGGISNLLPEQLLVDILAERFQLSDCHRGIVIDGLESVYAQSAASALQIILKALDNRKRIFVVNFSDSYEALKAREEAQREAEEALEKEEAEREETWWQELDDEKYDALPEEKKKNIDQRLRKKERQQKLRELEHLKEQEQKRLQEEMTRLKEEELKNKKGGKKDPKEVSTEESALERKQPNQSVVNELQSQFSVYEQTREQVDHILQHWDRARGLLLVPLPGDEAPPVFEDAQTVKKTAVGKESNKHGNKISSLMPSQMSVPAAAGVVLPQDIIPQIVLNVTGKDYPSAAELLKGSTLPPLAEVLDDLGLGPSGPPVPPPTTFSVVSFPENREQSNIQLTGSCFTFLVPFGLDKQEEEKNDWVEDMRASVEKEGAGVEGRSKASLTKNKDIKSRESQKSKRQTPDKTKAKGSKRSSSPRFPLSSPPDCAEQDQHHENVELKRSQSLTTFRWVVPANGEVVLRIWFYSEVPGAFEQTFNFELLGTRRRYQLLCRGIVTYPSIC
ncbi:hydrocephalus-inducing protein homolog isoform X2 [Gasterosteus aculeatus]